MNRPPTLRPGASPAQDPPTSPSDPDWRAFREWLISERGVSRRTATTAASQVRRVLRDAVEVEEDGTARVTRASLRRWHDAQESHKRTPIVSNWRRYREWWASKGVEGLPDFPRRVALRDGEVPGEVAGALASLTASGVSLPVLSTLRWSPLDDGDALLAALAVTTPGLLDGSLVALRATTGIVLLPMVHVRPILCWAHAGAPELEAPLLPTAPGSSEAMPLTRLRRLARRGKRA